MSKSASIAQLPLLLPAKQVVEQLIPMALRTWRRHDSSGKCPAGIMLGGGKFWRQSDIEQWVAWGCPDRKEFEARMQLEARRLAG